MNQRLVKANEAIWHQVNRVREWHTLPLPLALLNLRAFRDDLRETNLYDTEDARAGRTAATAPRPSRSCPSTAPTTARCQDPPDPEMGRSARASGATARSGPRRPEPMPRLLSPSPREVSTRLLNRDSSSRRRPSTCSPRAGSSSRTTTGSATARTRRTYIDIAARRGRRVAGRRHRCGCGARAPTAPGPQAACRRPTSTPSPTGGTSRRSTARPRSATASCARARTARSIVEDGHAPERDRPEARRRRPHRLLRQLLGRARRSCTRCSSRSTTRSATTSRAHYPTWDDERLFLTARLVNSALMREDPHRRVDARDPRQPGARARDARQLVRGPAALGAPEVRPRRRPR